ncbi:hypothetical protein J4G08_02500 [Candidatus Poribacteria bacterium]|nr:hypothetical protein [Candidatus Poribacteria bacterium]
MSTLEIFIRGALQYLVPTLFFTVILAITIAWGIRLGGMWLLREASNDVHLEEWLRRIFNNSDNKS